MYKGEVELREASACNFRVIDSDHILKADDALLFFSKYNHALLAFKELQSKYSYTWGVKIQIRDDSRFLKTPGWRTLVLMCQRSGLKMLENSVHGALIMVSQLKQRAGVGEPNLKIHPNYNADKKDGGHWTTNVIGDPRPEKTLGPTPTINIDTEYLSEDIEDDGDFPPDYPNTQWVVDEEIRGAKEDKPLTNFGDKNPCNEIQLDMFAEVPKAKKAPKNPFITAFSKEYTKAFRSPLKEAPTANWTTLEHRVNCVNNESPNKGLYGDEAHNAKEQVIDHNIKIFDMRYNKDEKLVHAAYEQMMNDLGKIRNQPFHPDLWVLID